MRRSGTEFQVGVKLVARDNGESKALMEAEGARVIVGDVAGDRDGGGASFRNQARQQRGADAAGLEGGEDRDVQEMEASG